MVRLKVTSCPAVHGLGTAGDSCCRGEGGNEGRKGARQGEKEEGRKENEGERKEKKSKCIS